MAGHALEEKESSLLVQDGVGGAAGVTNDVFLDVSFEHVLNVLLLKLALHHQLVVSVDGTSCTQLGKQKGQQMFGHSMKPEIVTICCKNLKKQSRPRIFLHFGNFGKVDEGRLLCSDFDHLRRPHDEFLGAAFHRVGILVLDDDEDSLQKFVIGVVPIFSVPSTAWTFCHIFYNSRKVKLNTIFRQVKV